MFFCVLRSLGFVGWAPKMAVVEREVLSNFGFWRQKISGTSFDKRIEDVWKPPESQRATPKTSYSIDSGLCWPAIFLFLDWPSNKSTAKQLKHQQVGFPKDYNIYHPSTSWMLMHHTGWWFQTFGLFSMSYMGCHPSHLTNSYLSEGFLSTTNQICFLGQLNVHWIGSGGTWIVQKNWPTRYIHPPSAKAPPWPIHGRFLGIGTNTKII